MKAALLIAFSGIVLVAAAPARPSRAIAEPPLVLLSKQSTSVTKVGAIRVEFADIAPDTFLTFYFALAANERALVDSTARRLSRQRHLSNDESNRQMIKMIVAEDAPLAARLAAVMDAIVEKEALLTPPARDLFNMVRSLCGHSADRLHVVEPRRLLSVRVEGRRQKFEARKPSSQTSIARSRAFPQMGDFKRGRQAQFAHVSRNRRSIRKLVAPRRKQKRSQFQMS